MVAPINRKRTLDIVQIAAGEWQLTVDGRPEQVITSEIAARIIGVALGIRVLEHPTNGVRWKLSSEVWQCTDRHGTEEYPVACSVDRMAAALRAAGWVEVTS